MPKAHFPLRGGPQPPYWSPPSRPAKTDEASADSFAPNSRASQDLEVEVQRLRQELQRVQRESRTEGAPLKMVWLALAFCGAGLLFAMLAILNHG